MKSNRKILTGYDVYAKSGKFYKRVNEAVRNFSDDERTFKIPLPMDYVSRNPFHLDNSMISIAIEEVQKRNALNGGMLTQVLSTLLLMKETNGQDEIPSPDTILKDHSRVISKRSHVISQIIADSTQKESADTGRHYFSNSVIINGHSLWYKSYVHIEPLPKGVTATRNEEVVKHEFTHILSNIYLVKPRRNSEESGPCNCIPPKRAREMLKNHEHLPAEFKRDDVESFSHRGCGERCINRLCYEECDPLNCPCGEDCTNQVFRRHEYQKLVLFYDSRKGWGVRTDVLIPRGTFVIEYVGEVISQKESEIRRQKRHGQLHMYYMSLGPNQLIDATDKGNASRFINHSCDPNCEIQKWATGDTYSVGIFAIRDIQPGEELTFDYQFERIGNTSTPCFCGSPKCRHVLGKNKEVPNVNNLPLAERMNRNRLFECDCMMDTIDKIVMPTTLLPYVCKGILKSLVGYINTFNLSDFSNRGKKRPSPTDPLESENYKLQDILVTPSAEENEEEKEERIPVYRRFSSRGIQKNYNNSLMLNRNISRGLKRYQWVYSREHRGRLGLVDIEFFNTLKNPTILPLLYYCICL